MFHYVLTNALVWASEPTSSDFKFKRLNEWADQYNGNVNNKYSQVCSIPPYSAYSDFCLRGSNPVPVDP